MMQLNKSSTRKVISIHGSRIPMVGIASQMTCSIESNFLINQMSIVPKTRTK